MQKCIFFVIPGDRDMLLGMPDFDLLDILQINYNTIGKKKEENGGNCNKNKRDTINAGSEQCYANTCPEKDCNKNTCSSLKSNNRLCNALFPMVKDTKLIIYFWE